MIPPFVDAGWLARHRDEVVLADVRWYLDGRSGQAAYREAHLPGARFVDLDRWLTAPAAAAAGRHPLPDPAVFAAGLSSLGVGAQTPVVGYDDAGGVIAARLVWLLRAVDHPAALLDGGVTGWPGPWEQGEPTAAPEPGNCPVRDWPAGRLATIDDASDIDQVVLDAREAERFRGEQEPVDPRAGHIPGARSLPCRENLTADGRLRPVAELRAAAGSVGVGRDDVVISYCGSGVTACHNLLVLEHAGYPPGRLYPGSWSQYSNDPSRPVATGG